jgi:predicted membrane channel-forming protein YqfA (hemolysin III family)
MTPAVIYAAGPALVVAAVAAWRRRDRPSMLALAWFVGTFVPFLFVSFQHRANYIYYMLVVLPAVYIAVALMFSRRYVPRTATVAYGALLLYGLWALYPIRAWT